jgi:hypothetical protein
MSASDSDRRIERLDFPPPAPHRTAVMIRLIEDPRPDYHLVEQGPLG